MFSLIASVVRGFRAPRLLKSARHTSRTAAEAAQAFFSRCARRLRRSDRVARSRKRRYRDRVWTAAELLEDRTLLSGLPAAFVPSVALPQSGGTAIPQSVSTVAAGNLRSDLGYGSETVSHRIDFNLDGRADIAFGLASSPETESAGSTIGGIGIALNEGGAQPSFSHVLVNSSPIGSVVGIAVADLDGDNALDVVTASRYFNDDGELRGRIDWWENSYDAENSGQPLTFTQHEVALDTGALLIGPTMFIDVGDVDRDGHVDIAVLSGTSPGTPSTLHWFRNSGTANPTFQARFASRPNELGNGPGGFVLADLDGDTDLDFVAATNKAADPENERDFLGSEIVWYENSAIDVGRAPNQAGQVIDGFASRTLFTSGHTRYAGLEAGDLTGNPTPEIVALVDVFEGGISASQVELYQPTIDGRITDAWNREVLGSAPYGESYRALDLADRDSDGDLDVVAGASHGNAWYGHIHAYDNIGGFFSQQELFAGNYWDPNSYSIDLHALAVVDLDGDGDADIAAGETAGSGASTEFVSWYEQVRFEARNDWLIGADGFTTTLKVLDNDIVAGPATVTIIRQDEGFEAVVQADNTIRFTPEPGYASFEDPVTFDYRLEWAGGSSVATVSVMISPQPVAPNDIRYAYRYREELDVDGNTSQFAVVENDGFPSVAFRHTRTHSTPLAIVDLGTVTSSMLISGRTAPVQDVNVRINLTHTWDSDLNVYLIAPNGQRVELFTSVGGPGDNFLGTFLDGSAANSIASGTAPFTGTFRPEGSLAALNGLDPNGVWTLEITDTAGGDVGQLQSWSLDILSPQYVVQSWTQPVGGTVGYTRDSNGVEIFTFLPDPGFLGETSFEYTASGSQWNGSSWVTASHTATVVTYVYSFNEAPRIDAAQFPALSNLSSDFPIDIPLEQLISDYESSFDELAIRAIGFGVDAKVLEINDVTTLRLRLPEARPAGETVWLYLEAVDPGEGNPAWVEPRPLKTWSFLSITLGTDTGDAPATYGNAEHGGLTGSSSNGTSFFSPQLGVLVDREFAAAPGETALGDDLNNPSSDDEDGVRFFGPIVASQSEARTNYLDVTAPQGGVLQGWIDFDQNGVFDAGESLFGAGLALSAWQTRVSYIVPAGALEGTTYARFRISSEGGLGPSGLARNGEVEDYRIAILEVEAGPYNHPPEAEDFADIETAGQGPAIASAYAPFTGTFRPEQPLSRLDGGNPNGTWRLEIADSAGGDVGALNQWSLAITTDEGTFTHTSADVPIAISDYQTSTSLLAVSGRTGTILDVNVALDISHTWDSDLQATLVAPDGTRISLFRNVGGSANHFTGTVLDDDVATPWVRWLGSHVSDAETTDQDDFRYEVSNAQNGTVSVDAYGLVSFTPDSSDFVGTASFQYTVWDAPEGVAGRESSTGTVTIHYSRLADLGDAPPSYGTALEDGGPYHLISTAGSGPRLGWSEVDGRHIDLSGDPPNQSSLHADGDDIDWMSSGVDDEDLWLGDQVRGDTNGIWVYVDGAEGGYLDAWMDFGRDGEFDPVNDRLRFGASSIASADAPFTGTFRPEESLTAFDGGNPNGTWTLEITDDYGADVGTLNAWSLAITTLGGESPDVTVEHASSAVPVAIEDYTTSTSTLAVSGRTGAIADVNVSLDISHTWVGDLRVFLIGPDGTRVQLFANIGGSGSDFTGTVLDDDVAAPTSLYLSSGWHYLTYDVPVTAERGTTFARFRISSTGNLSPTGGAPDGEVEDHEVRIVDSGHIEDLEVTARQGNSTAIDLRNQVDPYGLLEGHLEYSLIPESVTGGTALLDGSCVTFTPGYETIGIVGFSYRVRNTLDQTFREARVNVRVTRFQDFGDAPDQYGTTLANDGARHNFPESRNPLFLGRVGPDAERDGQPRDTALGDDARGDDEEGVRFMTWIGARNTLETPFILKVNAPAEGVLDGWIDFNADGDFLDEGERVFNHECVVAGSNLFTIWVPAGDAVGDTYARFRISSAGVDGPTGAAPDGEVEDYQIRINEGDGRDYTFVSDTTVFDAVHRFDIVEVADEQHPEYTDEQLQALLEEQTRLFIAQFLQQNPGLTGYTFVILVDPVDFVVTDPTNRQVGFKGSNLVNPDRVGFSYTGNGAVEVLVIPNAAPGDYRVELAGVGGDYRGSMFLLGPDGSVNNATVFQGTLGNGQLAVPIALDFNAPQLDGFLLGNAIADNALNSTGQVFLSVLDAAGETDVSLDALSQLAGLDAENESVSDGNAARELVRMAVTARSSAFSARRALFREITPRWLADAWNVPGSDDPSLAEAFWAGLGESLMGGIPSRVFHLAELLSVDIPQLFQPGEPPATAPAADGDAASTEAPPAAAETLVGQGHGVGAADRSANGSALSLQISDAGERQSSGSLVAAVGNLLAVRFGAPAPFIDESEIRRAAVELRPRKR